MTIEPSMILTKVLDWVFWWRTDHDQLARQVAEYDTLGVTASARGISFLMLIFSAFVTVVMVELLELPRWPYIEAASLLTLGYLMYKGHRWAILTTMVLWSIDKLSQIFVPSLAGAQANAIVPLLWWAIYMHAFYLTWQVEERKRSATQPSLTI